MKSTFFRDILKSKVANNGFKFSQGRVYLFVFILCYIAALGYYLFVPNVDSMTTIIEALQWAILLFAAYVFGGKGIEATKQVFKIKNEKDTTDGNDTTNPPVKTPTPPANNGNTKEEDLCT